MFFKIALIVATIRKWRSQRERTRRTKSLVSNVMLGGGSPFWSGKFLPTDMSETARLELKNLGVKFYREEPFGRITLRKVKLPKGWQVAQSVRVASLTQFKLLDATGKQLGLIEYWSNWYREGARYQTVREVEEAHARFLEQLKSTDQWEK